MSHQPDDQPTWNERRILELEVQLENSAVAIGRVKAKLQSAQKATSNIATAVLVGEALDIFILLEDERYTLTT